MKERYYSTFKFSIDYNSKIRSPSGFMLSIPPESMLTGAFQALEHKNPFSLTATKQSLLPLMEGKKTYLLEGSQSVRSMGKSNSV